MKQKTYKEIGTHDVVYTSAESIIEQLQGYIGEHGNDCIECSLDSLDWGEHGEAYVCVYLTRDETDEEYSSRIQREELCRQYQRDRDRATFEELKLKIRRIM